MKKILLIIVILISSFSYYGAVNENGEKITSFENLTQDNEIARNERKEENVIAKNEITQEVEQKTEENNTSNTQVIQSNSKDNKKENNTEKVTTSKSNNSNQSKTVNVKQNNTNASTNNNTQNKEETVKNTEEQAKTENTVTVQNQTKYVRNDTMIQKIKSVIENNVTEDMKKYGYTIVVDSSIKELTNQFTFTESRVISNIKYSFGTIRIYAEDYYSNGKLIMTECYIL